MEIQTCSQTPIASLLHALFTLRLWLCIFSYVQALLIAHQMRTATMGAVSVILATLERTAVKVCYKAVIISCIFGFWIWNPI